MEHWRLIKALDGAYEASDLGNIRNAKTKRLKATVFDGYYLKFGYDYVYEKQRHQGWYRVHRAIAETFIPNPERKNTVNHIDGDHQNNRVDNLEWATNKEQSIHAAKVLKTNCGENSYNAQFTNNQVREMRKLFESGEKTVNELAELFSAKPAHIRRIVKYERWRNI